MFFLTVAGSFALINVIKLIGDCFLPSSDPILIAGAFVLSLKAFPALAFDFRFTEAVDVFLSNFFFLKFFFAPALVATSAILFITCCSALST